MEKADLIFAPFSRVQVIALNRYQRSGLVHPYTCSSKQDSTEIDEIAYKKLHPNYTLRTLIATEKCWVCPGCGKTQDWAHKLSLKKWKLPRKEKKRFLKFRYNIGKKICQYSYVPVDYMFYKSSVRKS
jgi:hypothetical protein